MSWPSLNKGKIIPTNNILIDHLNILDLPFGSRSLKKSVLGKVFIKTSVADFHPC